MNRSSKIILFLWIIFLLGWFSVIGIFYSAHQGILFFDPLPLFSKIDNPDVSLASEILSEDDLVIGKYFKKNRTDAEYDDLSPYLVQALISTEDKRFYEHSGIDLKGTLRAIFTFSKSGGGSTITQQLAKMMFNEPASSKWMRVKQKIQEWILAVEIEKRYTKEEIITMYLNTFDYLNNAVGIESAAEVYFSKRPNELDILESAMLVGMAKNPSLYNPIRRPEKTRKRREVVLKLMVSQEYIEDSTYKRIYNIPIELKYKKVDHNDGLAPYFREYLRMDIQNKLREKDEQGNYLYTKNDGEPYNIYTDGLKLYTTINSKMQRYAEWSVNQYIKKELQPVFSRDLKRYNVSKYPFDKNITRKQYKSIMRLAIRRSKTYRIMAGKQCENCGRRGSNNIKKIGDRYVCLSDDCQHEKAVVSQDSIYKYFKKPEKRQLYSYQGVIDTFISLEDSIKYFKTFLQAGLMSLDPHTGYIKAWVGGLDYHVFKYDHVKQSKRQVGSTFKPILYALATQNGYSPCYKVPNTKVTFRTEEFDITEDWTPQNSDGVYGCEVTLKYALANSMNTVSAWLMKQFGVSPVVNFASKLGIKKLPPFPSVALGVTDRSVYEMVGAMATFANKGVYIEPTFLLRVEDKNGKIIFDTKPKITEAMSPKSSYQVLNMMKGVVDGVENKCIRALKNSYIRKSGTGIRLRTEISKSRKYVGHHYPVAAKTGTTQNNSDGWFIGLTPDLATGVWVGAEDRSVHFSTTTLGQGANTGLPIWGYYMQKIHADSTLVISKADFEKPDNFFLEDCDNNNNQSEKGVAIDF